MTMSKILGIEFVTLLAISVSAACDAVYNIRSFTTFLPLVVIYFAWLPWVVGKHSARVSPGNRYPVGRAESAFARTSTKPFAVTAIRPAVLTTLKLTTGLLFRENPHNPYPLKTNRDPLATILSSSRCPTRKGELP